MTTPSEAHFAAFGRLVYHYASVETGLKFCLAGMLNLPHNIVMIMSEPYTSLQLRNVVKSTAKEYDFRQPDSLKALVHIVGEFASHGPLRNYVAHSRWTKGGRDGAIKPSGVDIRAGHAVYRGWDPTEPDWTAEDIENCAKKLARVNQRILQLMRDEGFSERIESHIEAAKAAIE